MTSPNTLSTPNPLVPDPSFTSDIVPPPNRTLDESCNAPACSIEQAYAARDGDPLSACGARMLRDTPTMSPIREKKRSASASPLRLTMPFITPGQLAFTAMNFLPVPVLVLNNLKTVVLANEAMGKLLGVVDASPLPADDALCESLRGQTLSQIGIDMIQDGRPVWVSWDAFLDDLVFEMGTKQAKGSSISLANHVNGDSNSTSTSDESKADMSSGILGKPALDSAVDVVVMHKNANMPDGPNLKRSERQTFAKMIITIWEIENNQTYFTLTFTNAESSAAPTASRRVRVARVSTLEAAERKSISNSNPPSLSSGHSSSSNPFNTSPSSVTVSTSHFPPMGPPSRLPPSSTPSILQKMTIIKDALLDKTDMPILAMWIDGSSPVMNRAARDLFLDTTVTDGEFHDGYDLLSRWEVWNGDFTRKYLSSELPISVLIKERKPFPSWRIGMHNRKKNSDVVYDVLGELVTNDETGEVVAGIITCRDVTHLAQEITDIKVADEERFKLICDTMPQMVWTATPQGVHDFFNTRWYDYTGLSPEDSIGDSWKHPFHPDDMPAPWKRWKHCLVTGEPYAAEYRCRSKEGEWRWMLGRALPLRNKHTGAIEKWFGTCTDVHEALEAKMTAKQTREQLLSVLTHAHTTIFSVDHDLNVTMLEGALAWNTLGEDKEGGGSEITDPQSFVGKSIGEVFTTLNPRLRSGEFPAFLEPAKLILSGERTSETVHEHTLGKYILIIFCGSHSNEYIDNRFYRTRFLPHIEKVSQDGQNASPVIKGVIGVIMDVTELKKREQDLEEQVKEKRQLKANEAAAKEASRLKSQFLANVRCIISRGKKTTPAFLIC